MTWLGTGWSRLKRDRVLSCSLEDGYARVGEGEASLSQLDAALCLHLQMFIKNLLQCARRARQTDMATGLWAHVFHCVARN